MRSAQANARNPGIPATGADFYGKNPKELRAALTKSLQVLLDVCAEKVLRHRSAAQLRDTRTRMLPHVVLSAERLGR